MYLNDHKIKYSANNCIRFRTIKAKVATIRQKC